MCMLYYDFSYTFVVYSKTVMITTTRTREHFVIIKAAKEVIRIFITWTCDSNT